jgi:hypothetical protein
LSSVRFNIEQSVKNYSTSKSVLVEKREKKWIVRANFAICLHNKDKALLELVQSYFGGIGGFSQ